MNRMVAGRWFALFELALVFLCGVACFVWPQLGGWPLLVALLPWVLRLFARQQLFQRTPLDFPILLFVVTALVGAWAAYDTSAGLNKLWLIIGAVLLYYALARQPRDNLWLVAGALSVLGALLALYFLLTHDWAAQPADLEFITRLGVEWMALRPQLPLALFQPNKVGGLLAILAPFSLALVFKAWRGRDARMVVFALISSILVLLGLVFTSSRAAWLASSAALCVWLFWTLVCGSLRERMRLRPAALFAMGVVIGLAAVFILGKIQPGGIPGLVSWLPGPNTAIRSLEIYANTRWLISDFPITGGGLASFPGLYSQYVMSVPFFFFGYAHDLYLDIALEQGIIGMLSFVFILGGSFWLVVGRESAELLDGAVLAGLMVMALHGLVDDPLYAEQGTPLLFLLPGFASALALTDVRSREQQRSLLKIGKAWWAWATLSLLVLAYLVFVLASTGGAAWGENLAALRMERIELADYPGGEWNNASNLPELAPAEALFVRALQQDDHAFTSHYRLGLLDLLRRDFSAARQHLEHAHDLAPEHRGVRKALAYCYVWLSLYEDAIPLLQGIPEAKSEMEVYRGWWGMQERNDLAAKADRMIRLLP